MEAGITHKIEPIVYHKWVKSCLGNTNDHEVYLVNLVVHVLMLMQFMNCEDLIFVHKMDCLRTIV